MLPYMHLWLPFVASCLDKIMAATPNYRPVSAPIHIHTNAMHADAWRRLLTPLLAPLRGRGAAAHSAPLRPSRLYLPSRILCLLFVILTTLPLPLLVSMVFKQNYTNISSKTKNTGAHDAWGPPACVAPPLLAPSTPFFPPSLREYSERYPGGARRAAMHAAPACLLAAADCTCRLAAGLHTYYLFPPLREPPFWCKRD